MRKEKDKGYNRERKEKAHLTDTDVHVKLYASESLAASNKVLNQEN